MMIFLKSLLFSLSVTFFLLMHPIMLSLLLICISICIIFTLFEPNMHHWYSYMICLVYLGGVLVLFTYISCFLPNVMISTYPLFITMSFFFCMMFIPTTLNKNYFFMNENEFTYIMLMFSSNKFLLLLIILAYILIGLLIMVYFISFSKMPLRNLN